MNKKEKEIKLKCLDIQVNNIDCKLKTLTSLEYKVWIFLGFFFLVSFENIKYLSEAELCLFKIPMIIFFLISSYFLFNAFFLKEINKLYINVDSTMNYWDKFDIKWFIEHRHEDYKEINDSIDHLIQKRDNSFKYGIIIFLLSLIPSIIYFLIK